MHFNGNGVPQDKDRGAEWYTTAAEQGHAEAQLRLGDMHFNGNGVPQDEDRGAEWYTTASAQGHAQAQCKLGNMHFNGNGVPKDKAMAAEWYTKAAAQGHAEAQLRLVEAHAAAIAAELIRKACMPPLLMSWLQPSECNDCSPHYLSCNIIANVPMYPCTHNPPRAITHDPCTLTLTHIDDHSPPMCNSAHRLRCRLQRWQQS